MYKLTNVQTRPNTSVAFWTKDHPALTQEYSTYYKDNYIVTGKHLSFDTEVSPDGLVLTTTIIWDTEASAISWKEDPVVITNFFTPQTTYFQESGISITRTEQEI